MSTGVSGEIVVLDYAGTRTSTFAGLTLSGFATGGFEAIYDDANTRVLLRVTDGVTPVPEPGTWALWLSGLAAVAGLTRRRARQRVRRATRGPGPVVIRRP